MSRSKDTDKIKLAEAKFITGESPEDIAVQLGVTRRTIDRWAMDGNWRNLREANSQTNVVPITSRQPKPKTQHPLPAFHSIRHAKIDDLEIIESALSQLHASLPEAEDKSKGALAGAIARLVELRRKLQPETVRELAERAIELGVGPDEFLQELRNAWARRA
ncbi:hypothetical protein [Iningainema tapete]|uniref:Uncharacterized protein n=1 Tax=Iningainema tapete BLCC-T55 TaxID=2748662 RepID=A0A8J6XD88_9CYAN|nr:hypothetical protein [Iningainema tapete]MBD2771158.1 hypothetical protein [Iningainema tapete BLCC-T55]